MKRDPRPSSDSTDSSPPCRCTISREIDRPSPDPAAPGLVVKKASKMRP